MKDPLVLVLAGGKGTRFQPLSINKTLFPFLGKPLIQHVLEMLEGAGFTDILITANEENEKWIKNYKSHKLHIRSKIQDHAAGMGDAVLNVENEIGSQPLVIINSVDIVEPSFLKAFKEKISDKYAAVTGKKTFSYMPAGYLKIEGDKVVDIIEKPEPGTEPSDMINLVFHYFSNPKDFISILKEVTTPNDDHYEVALASLMKEKEISYIPYEGYWQKLKFGHYVIDMMNIFLNNLGSYISPNAYVSRLSVIEGDVYIEDGARIEDFAVIKGPVYIGRNTVIGNHSLVRQSMVEEDSIIGFGSEIARSYIGPRSMLHHNFIGDSILESDVNPSYGTTTANLRFDNSSVMLKLPDKKIDTGRSKFGAIIAKGAFLGVNCSIMPGITIGENARVFPGTVVTEAVPAGELLR
jgi:UDP-N-acetylglucosamine diphosphorylase / glucose-1-phosphate thymidylyltransferase / UDP-N-acetylgalactosamine diphosphorylase / glucosamine-1-phosphate N-acetyltransferase / galactosamine-1-phosphate N-acetyltransferase